METLIIQVDCRPYGRDGLPQLGITVEDPLSKKDPNHKKDAIEQRKAQQQASHKEYQDHDYQNLDNGNFNRLDNGNSNSNNHNNNKATSANSQRPIKNVNSDYHRTPSSNGLQQTHKGLQITQIQQGSVIDFNGQFKVGDIIAEVNGVNLQRSFAEAQRTLKQFVVEHTSHGPLVLKVFRKTVPPTISTTSTPAESRHLVGALNTRKIGVKHRIRLRKAVNGFGIKIAERDNMHGTRHRPIFITAITTTGSAYQDGRLKEGDMLLEVNGMDLYGKSQTEVTKMLKSVGANEEVEFVVSRQENLANESSSTDEPGVYTYDIPLNDTKSAGLGLYLKYPRRTEDHKDLGIWIEKVITGGAAWKDGRLQPDDQILAINGINLLDLSNAEASETLTAAVCRGIGPEATPNTIRLKIHRRSSAVVEKILQGTNNGMEHFDVIPAEGQEKSSYSALTDKKINNSQDSYITALENTLQNNTLQNKTIANIGNSSGSSNSRSDSVMSPQTQASNSLGLTSSCNEKLDQNSGEKTNETTSSAISQITDTNSQSWDDESTDAPVGEDPFQRDGFGRQSISEKRHAQLSAWSTDTFRRNQRLREEQEQQRLLEEQMARQCFEVAVDVHMPPQKQQSQLTSNSNNNDRVTRNRKINDSFRKAVDRSYEDSINVVPQVPTYDLTIRQERSVDRLDNNRRISTGTATKIINSVANSTGSTANKERYLIARMKNEPARQIEEMGAQESKLNDNNNTAHKKSSSLLNKLLKFGSIKRKKKTSNKDKTTTTSNHQDERTKEIEVKQQSSRTSDVPNQNQTRKAHHNTQQYSQVPNSHQHHNHVHDNNLQQQHIQQHNSFAMYPHQQPHQHQVQLSTPSDQLSANHHIMHQHSSLYSSGRSAQMMNSHVPQPHAMNGRPPAMPQQQHPSVQWQSSYFQSPSGLWVTNPMVPAEIPPQLPPNNVYATLPHHHSQHHNHVHNNNLQQQHIQQLQHNSFAMYPHQQPHQHQVQLPTPSYQMGANHHVHQHSGLYSSGRSAQMMNSHVTPPQTLPGGSCQYWTTQAYSPTHAPYGGA